MNLIILLKHPSKCPYSVIVLLQVQILHALQMLVDSLTQSKNKENEGHHV